MTEATGKFPAWQHLFQARLRLTELNATDRHQRTSGGTNASVSLLCRRPEKTFLECILSQEKAFQSEFDRQYARLIEQAREKLSEVEALRELAESQPSTNSERLNRLMDAEGQRLLQSQLDLARKTIDEEVAQERARMSFASPQTPPRKKPPRQMV